MFGKDDIIANMRRRSFTPSGLPLVLLIAIPYYAAFAWIGSIVWQLFEPTGFWQHVILWIVGMLWIAGPQAMLMRRLRRHYQQQRKQSQIQRNQEAHQLLQQVKQLEQGAKNDQELPLFFFWFRPFDVADQLPFTMSNSWKWWRFMLEGNFEVPKSIDAELDLETCVAEALHHVGIVVALKEKGEAPGPGKIEVPNAQWKPTIELLGPKASAFFILPYYSDGAVWEVVWLKKNGRLVDSIFIMPPKPSSGFNRSAFDIGDYHWYEIRRRLKNYIELPEYDPKGMLIWFTNDGAVARTRHLKRQLSVFRNALPDHVFRSMNTDFG